MTRASGINRGWWIPHSGITDNAIMMRHKHGHRTWILLNRVVWAVYLQNSILNSVASRARGGGSTQRGRDTKLVDLATATWLRGVWGLLTRRTHIIWSRVCTACVKPVKHAPSLRQQVGIFRCTTRLGRRSTIDFGPTTTIWKKIVIEERVPRWHPANLSRLVSPLRVFPPKV